MEDVQAGAQLVGNYQMDPGQYQISPVQVQLNLTLVRSSHELV